ncbi:6-phosphogluconate dehydrogenase, decarboxylating-like [Corticium candelabrum]|uniref:6-phosphogluconate dehydrogenase, decarboxylating-like n=1 Tax=Corticium candelabrum TaxID=121492 RepID=UPI002E254D20|nr:6-phosphogluconate dehydrogenase, decarboxylating-like [Corticium candelabrum]
MQKGTGKWTAISSLDLGIPVTLIGESVFARCLSSLKDERVTASKSLKGPSTTKYEGDRKEIVEHIRQALYASKIISYAQGFMLLREVAKGYMQLTLNYGSIALMWRGGCIIRSTAFAFYDGYRSGSLPANLIQAQRDYFGAHTYELLSKLGQFIHTN